MKFFYRENDGTLYVSIVGDLDNYHADEFKQKLYSLLNGNYRELVINLSYVPFISSSAIGKILVFYKQLVEKGKKLRIEGLNTYLFDLFHLTKLDQFLPLEQ